MDSPVFVPLPYGQVAGGSALAFPDLLVSLSSQVGRTPWPGFKSPGANKASTALALNYPHEWKANPTFISPRLWNAKRGLHRPDLHGGFCFAWVNSVSIFNMSMDRTSGTLSVCVVASDGRDPGRCCYTGHSPSRRSLTSGFHLFSAEHTVES